MFVAGAAVQWLRDGLKLFDAAPAVEELARRSDPEQPVLFVPGFVGLGAPHWVPEARGVLFGLTRGTTAADLGRAVLEGVAYQVADLIDGGGRGRGRAVAQPARGRRHGAQRLVLAVPGRRAGPAGGADAAQRGDGAWGGVPGRAGGPASGRTWKRCGGCRRTPSTFTPAWRRRSGERRLALWRRAVRAVIAFYTPEQ